METSHCTASLGIPLNKTKTFRIHLDNILLFIVFGTCRLVRCDKHDVKFRLTDEEGVDEDENYDRNRPILYSTIVSRT